MRVSDPRTILFILHEPHATFLTDLELPIVRSEDAFRRIATPEDPFPIGAGPYRLVKRDPECSSCAPTRTGTAERRSIRAADGRHPGRQHASVANAGGAGRPRHRLDSSAAASDVPRRPTFRNAERRWDIDDVSRLSNHVTQARGRPGAARDRVRHRSGAPGARQVRRPRAGHGQLDSAWPLGGCRRVATVAASIPTRLARCSTRPGSPTRQAPSLACASCFGRPPSGFGNRSHARSPRCWEMSASRSTCGPRKQRR